jgi:hypothetical protein
MNEESFRLAFLILAVEVTSHLIPYRRISNFSPQPEPFVLGPRTRHTIHCATRLTLF